MSIEIERQLTPFKDSMFAICNWALHRCDVDSFCEPTGHKRATHQALAVALQQLTQGSTACGYGQDWGQLAVVLELTGALGVIV